MTYDVRFVSRKRGTHFRFTGITPPLLVYPPHVVPPRDTLQVRKGVEWRSSDLPVGPVISQVYEYVECFTGLKRSSFGMSR